MDQVGYDMYCKLLDEVIKEMNGETIVEEVDVQIDINVSSYIPDEFIEDGSQKIETYQNIALCRDEKDIINVTDEIIDRYGKMPKEVENLLDIARITQKQNNIVFDFIAEDFKMSIVDKLIEKYKSKVKFSPSQRPYVTLKLNENANIISEIKGFLKEVIEA